MRAFNISAKNMCFSCVFTFYAILLFLLMRTNLILGHYWNVNLHLHMMLASGPYFLTFCYSGWLMKKS
jgi:hypothetical protein